jgi:E3 ubiquitin-protein ligase UBR4
VFKPTEIMGFYVFNKEVPVGYFAEEELGVTTVTHFNIIHHSCHREAVRADRRLKPPKSEWDGATIRNSHTLCNNIFPIHGPNITDQGYVCHAVHVRLYIVLHCDIL